jgi:uncharacterized protein YndB with AHSA1/START domain
MSDDRSGDATRRHEHEIEIDAGPAAVWQALTDPDDLANWYVERAEVEPREGGRFWVSWGEGMHGTSRIEVFDPERRLRLANVPPEEPDPAMPMPELDEPITEEFILDAVGPDGPVVVRMVHSGIPRGAAWDGFYDGTRRGWEAYMHWLRHYVEHHRGQQRRGAQIMIPVGDAEAAWSAMTGPDGLHIAASAAGGRFDVAGGPTGRLAGRILIWTPPQSLLARVTAPDDGLLYVSVERMPDAAMVVLGMAGYGWSPDHADAVTERWTAWAHEVLGVPRSADVMS